MMSFRSHLKSFYMQPSKVRQVERRGGWGESQSTKVYRKVMRILFRVKLDVPGCVVERRAVKSIEFGERKNE